MRYKVSLEGNSDFSAGPSHAMSQLLYRERPTFGAPRPQLQSNPLVAGHGWAYNGSMSTTQLFLLGPVRISRGDQPIDLTIGKGQALLAYLAISGAPQTREHLLDLLWPQSHPDAARKNLRNSLWRLRQTLGNEAVLTEDELVLLSSSVWTDVSTFESGMNAQLAATEHQAGESMESILALWRGPLLDGLRMTDAPDFDLWLAGERDRLGQIYLGGIKHLLARHREAGQWRESITVAQQALAYDGTQESIHVALMEAYAYLGQRTDALRQYDTLRTVLEQELGIAPLADTQALRSKILGGQLAAPIAPAVEQSTEARPPRVERQRPDRPFVGRRNERETLDEALQLAAGGQLQIVQIFGELGIGKSTLWQQWSVGLPPAITVLEARCLDSTQSLPFAPIAGLFGTQICMERFAGQRSPVSPVWLTELTRLLPHIRDFRPELPTPVTVPPEEERRRLFEALAQSLRALAAAPLILFIDDLHWADQATLDWLTYLADRMRDEPLLLVCAYRANEASPGLANQFAAWSRTNVARPLSLAPLSVDEATELIAALDGNVGMVDHLHSQSGGNPYYLTELNRVHPDGAPAALADLLGARLRGLPDAALRLLQTAAILEPTISFEMLQRVSGQDEEETLDALDVLLDMAILVERGENYEFAHPLLAGIVCEGLSTPRRRRLHQRVAEHLLAIHEDELESIVGRLARHFAEAGDSVEAARYAEMAAAQAAQLGAMTEAVNFYRRAYALDPTPGRQLALGYTLMHVPGGIAEARESMRQALDAFESLRDQAGIVQAALRLAVSFLSTEQGEQVLHWVERILIASAESDDIELQATAEYLMAAGKLYSRDTMAEADAHYREATRLASEHNLDSDIAIQSWFGWGNLSVQCGEYALARSKFERTLALTRTTGNIYFESLCYNNLAYATLLDSDVAAAHAAVDSGLDFIEANQLLRPRQYLYSTRGEVALAERELDAAESWFVRAIEEARVYDNETHAINVRAHLGRVALARGDSDGAEQLLTEALSAIPAGGALYLHTQIELWLADLYLERNEHAAAEAYLNAAQEKLAGSQRMAQQRAADQISERLRHRSRETEISRG